MSWYSAISPDGSEHTLEIADPDVWVVFVNNVVSNFFNTAAAASVEVTALIDRGVDPETVQIVKARGLK